MKIKKFVGGLMLAAIPVAIVIIGCIVQGSVIPLVGLVIVLGALAYLYFALALFMGNN